jgi:tetratricopeptide (TPR) repeat protein
MKRITILLLLVSATAVYAQKTPKPNLNKAFSSWREGNLEEAKAIIDVATTYEKTMDDAKTWYYRGLIYASIDTTTNEAYNALDPNALSVAMESFKKADEMNAGGKEHFIQDAMGMPITKTQQIDYLGNTYLNKGADAYQEEDLDGAMVNFKKAQLVRPTDTLAFFYAGFVSHAQENYDDAIASFEKYIENGGKDKDAYLSIINIYSSVKENKEEALKWVRKAKPIYPADPDLPKVEIGLLIDLKRIDEAKAGLESAIKTEPDNKLLHFYLGYANSSLGDLAAAKKNYEEALRIDPKYFDAQLYLSKLMYKEAADIKSEMAGLGITAADKKKRFELDAVLVEKLKVALPYWEKAEQLNPSDQEVLDTLQSIYRDLDMQPQLARINARYKELGLEN